jgi:hypothetical protein
MATYCVDDEWKCIVECLAEMHNGNGWTTIQQAVRWNH